MLAAYLMMIGTTLCWGANTVLGQLAVGHVSPMLLVSLRWLAVLLLLAVFAHRVIGRDLAQLKRSIRFLALMGAIGFTGFNSLFYIAAHTTSALNIGIIQGSIPVFVIFGSFLAFRSTVGTWQMLGVLITLIGVATVASEGDWRRLTALAIRTGDFLMLAACACYAAYAVGLRRRPAVSALGFFAALSAFAFVSSLPLSAIESWQNASQWPTAQGWVVIAVIALLPSFLAQILFINAVALIGPSRAGVFVNLVPVFGAMMAVGVLHEPFRWFHGISLALVLGGIWIAERNTENSLAQQQRSRID